MHFFQSQTNKFVTTDSFCYVSGAGSGKKLRAPLGEGAEPLYKVLSYSLHVCDYLRLATFVAYKYKETEVRCYF